MSSKRFDNPRGVPLPETEMFKSRDIYINFVKNWKFAEQIFPGWEDRIFLSNVRSIKKSREKERKNIGQ